LAAPARNTQSLALLLCDGAAAAANVTQSLALVNDQGAGQARSTQALAAVVDAGAGQARATQLLAYPVAGGAGQARATQNLILVVAPAPQPARVTQALALPVCSGDTDGDADEARTTQNLVYVVAEDGAPIGANVTQSLVLVAGEYPDQEARVTQSLVYVVNDPQCPDVYEGYLSSGLRDLTRRVFRLLGEDTDEPTYWSTAEVERLINSAAISLERETRVYEFVYSTSTVVGQTRYLLPENAMTVKRVFLEDKRMEPRTPVEMDVERPGWEQIEDEIKHYVQKDNASITLGHMPTAVEDLVVWCVGTRSTPLSSPCDTSELPTWMHPAIPLKAAAMALSGYGERRNLPLSKAYDAMAGDYVSLLLEHVGR